MIEKKTQTVNQGVTACLGPLVPELYITRQAKNLARFIHGACVQITSMVHFLCPMDKKSKRQQFLNYLITYVCHFCTAITYPCNKYPNQYICNKLKKIQFLIPDELYKTYSRVWNLPKALATVHYCKCTVTVRWDSKRTLSRKMYHWA